MKVVATKSNLVRLLSQLSLVAKAKATTPILTCCLLETTATGIKGSATDLFQSVTSSAPADVKTAGGVAVSARDLLDRVKTLPEGLVQLELTETKRDGQKTIKLLVQSGKRKHQLPCIAAEEFPPLPTGPVTGFDIGGSTLLSLLKRTKPMALSDPSRDMMHGVCLEFHTDKVIAAATDSHRCSFVEEAVPGAVAAKPMLVSLEAVDALMGLLDDEAPCTVGMVGQELAFAIGPELTLLTKLTATTFPPVRLAFQNVPQHEIRISRAALSDALISIERPTEGVVRGFFHLTATQGLLKMKADGKGAAEDEVDAAYDGPDVTVGINARYILEALATIDTEEVRLNMGADRGVDPVLIRPTDERVNVQVVMPQYPGQA